MEKREWTESCVLCECYETRGIHILESFLCYRCEKAIVRLEPEDPEYLEAIKKLRKIKAATLLS
ncbi:sigma factor G inhibitor Gin [Salibacterium salarium]|uniref:Sigma factor G inhibitor Gin n=1 Tax=Salibacterium salarium TaxID=284579 RepID=A0A3R9NYJ0_9BACI|nr:sigma factor G inhibitor Gin [Salibacterium salarium]RSL28904.1 sigma factor G inhibitor Gin [Salibacterium salarium]